MLYCLHEKADYILGELVGVIDKGGMVGAFQDEYLGYAISKELVALHDFIRSVCT